MATMAMTPARLISTKTVATATGAASTTLASWDAISATKTYPVAPPCVGGRNTFQSRRYHALIPSNNQLIFAHQSLNKKIDSSSQQIRNFARNKRGHPPPFNKYDFDDMNQQQPKEPKRNVLIIGSSGVLGKSLVSHFGTKFKWNVYGADVLDPEIAGENSSKGLRDYIWLPKSGSLSELTGELYRGVSHHLQGGESNKHKLDAIVCASGGWAGDVDMADMMENHLADANSSELEDVDFEEEYARESADVCERMMRMNYYPVVAGSQVGRRFMKRGGLFCIIGASAALSPTSGMLGYGSAKSAAHHYVQSWGPTSMEGNDISAVGILPLMIDTPANRAMLGDGDDEGDGSGGGDERYNKMVKPMHIANEIGEWIKQPHLRPHSGSLVKVIAKNRRDGSGGAAFHLVR